MTCCPRCGEPIEDGDAIDTINTEAGPTPFHWECAARMAIGGMNHLLKRCTCCGGTEPPDPPGLTRREAARHALAVFRVQQQAKALRGNDEN